MSMAYDSYSISADSAKLAVDEGEGTGKIRFVVGKIATQWKNFKKAMKEKRIASVRHLLMKSCREKK